MPPISTPDWVIETITTASGAQKPASQRTKIGLGNSISFDTDSFLSILDDAIELEKSLAHFMERASCSPEVEAVPGRARALRELGTDLVLYNLELQLLRAALRPADKNAKR